MYAIVLKCLTTAFNKPIFDIIDMHSVLKFDYKFVDLMQIYVEYTYFLLEKRNEHKSKMVNIKSTKIN